MVDDQLRAELLRRAEQDQNVRTTDNIDPAALGQVDADNLAWLRPIIRVRGWPTRSMVGEEASSAAWCVDERRAAMGLGPLEEYLAWFG